MGFQKTNNQSKIKAKNNDKNTALLNVGLNMQQACVYVYVCAHVCMRVHMFVIFTVLRASLSYLKAMKWKQLARGRLAGRGQNHNLHALNVVSFHAQITGPLLLPTLLHLEA